MSKSITTSFPLVYTERIDEVDIKKNEKLIKQIKHDKKNKNKVLTYQTDIENVVIHNYNLDTLRKTLIKYYPPQDEQFSLNRIIVDKDEAGVIISVSYHKLSSLNKIHEFNIPSFNDLKFLFLDENNIIKTHVSFMYDRNDDQPVIRLHCCDISFITLVRNLLETFDAYNVIPTFSEIWTLKQRDKDINTIYSMEFFLKNSLSENMQQSLKIDFIRYLQTYIKARSIFDLLGPSMVGPSSSHTAGANRIGQVARNIIIAMKKSGKIFNELNGIEIKLLGSFRDTGVGHGTPSALGSGLQGLDSDDCRIMEYGNPEFLKKNQFKIDGIKVPFKGFTKGSTIDENKYKIDKNNNIAEVILHTDNGYFTITGFSLGGGNIEVRYINDRLDNFLDGKKTLWLNDTNLKVNTSNETGSWQKINKVINQPEAKVNVEYAIPFQTFEELSEFIDNSGKSFLELVIEVETSMHGSTKQDIFNNIFKYLKIMRKSIQMGLDLKQKSLFGLTGLDASKIRNYINEKPIYNNIFGKAIAYATAVNEVNAQNKVIVACPTAGASGILPAVLFSHKELNNTKEQKLAEAMAISGFMGMILFDDVSTAGADYGCQAEIGAGAAMAAAALAYLEDGTHTQIIHAFTLAIKNCMGLICDPIAGLVEVPCVKRNGIYTSVAISAACMALSGVESFVSPDEVMLAVREVGQKLHKDYKETASGGLAKTRDGKRVENHHEKEVSRFFS